MKRNFLGGTYISKYQQSYAANYGMDWKLCYLHALGNLLLDYKLGMHGYYLAVELINIVPTQPCFMLKLI